MVRVNVGLSRKTGEANYGSRGASVNFEVELEPQFSDQPDQLRAAVRRLFQLARVAVEEELRCPSSNGEQHTNGANGNSVNGNGHSRSNGEVAGGTNGHGRMRQATESQLRAIRLIANRRRIDLPTRLRAEFGVERPDELSIRQASDLIDQLKSPEHGAGGGS